MNKILIYAAVAVLVLVLILGYWQFFVGYACGLATFWFLGEHTLRMAAGNLCSKGKEIGNELKEKVTPSAQREVWLLRIPRLCQRRRRYVSGYCKKSDRGVFFCRRLAITWFRQNCKKGRTLFWKRVIVFRIFMGCGLCMRLLPAERFIR